MTEQPSLRHPELSIRISPDDHSFIIISKVTRVLRNNSKHDSIEDFMKQVLVAETDEEFMAIVNSFLRVVDDN